MYKALCTIRCMAFLIIINVSYYDHGVQRCNICTVNNNNNKSTYIEPDQMPNDCVNASSVNMFKHKIDRYLIRAGYT